MQTNNGKQSHIHPCPAVLSLRIEQWAPPSLSFSPSLPLIREKRIFERRRKKRFLPPLDKNARRTTSSRTLKRKIIPRLHFRDGGGSKRGVRSVHYTKVESAIESLLPRKAALYSGSRGENKRYIGVIPLSLGAFSIPASIRNSL